MSADKLEIARTEYDAGKVAFERGNYAQAVKHLETACGLAERGSRLGGEMQMWLVTAYQAAGLSAEAIALCKQLGRHPSLGTRQQARRLLYILEAPQLSTRPEWLVQIPDLTALEDNPSRLEKLGVGAEVKRPPRKRPESPPPVDLSQVNTKDNAFVWVALIVTVLLVAGLLLSDGALGFK